MAKAASKAQSSKASDKEMERFEYNFANVESVADRASDRVISLINEAKMNRRAWEGDRLEDLRLWKCNLTDNHMYMGRANLFIPELHNQIEATVSKFQTGLFPNDDYLHCLATNTTGEEDALKIQEAVKYELDVKNQLPVLMDRFQRQKALYGPSVLKGGWVDKRVTAFFKDKKGYAQKKEIPLFKGVKWDVVDVFHWYIYPETAELDTADLVFQESFVSKRVLADEAKESGKYANLDQVSEIMESTSEYSWIDVTRLVASNIGSASQLMPDSVLVTECWCLFDIEPGKYVPCVISLANMGQIIRVQRNPYYYQESPYLVGKYRTPPVAEFYPMSQPDLLRSLQYVMNDLGNQTMDSMTYSLNPISVIDPGFAGDLNSFKLQPGAKWLASPQSVDFKTFPDVSGQGFQGMNHVRAMIQQFSDQSPPIAPQLSGKVRSATQSQSVTDVVNQNQKNMIRSDEANVLVPMAARTHALLQQYMDEKYMIRVQGPDNGAWIHKYIEPADLVGDVDWYWRGSTVAEKSAVRSQQLLSFYNLALQSQQLMPGEIDLPKLQRMVAKEAFNMDISSIYTKEEGKKTVDPEVENIALDQGIDVMVNPGDNFEEHMEVHGEGMKACRGKDAKVSYLRHMERHKQQKEARDQLVKQQAQIQALQMQSQDAGNPQGGDKSTPSPGQGSGGGNPFQQQTPSDMGQVMQGVRATEPNL